MYMAPERLEIVEEHRLSLLLATTTAVHHYQGDLLGLVLTVAFYHLHRANLEHKPLQPHIASSMSIRATTMSADIHSLSVESLWLS